MKNLFFLLIFIANNCFCQTISGVVLDRETKKPLMGAKVYLTNRKETKDTVGICYHIVVDRNHFSDFYRFKIILETKTDSSGKFVFDSIQKGRYNIVADYKIKMPDTIHFPVEFFDKTAIDKKLNIDFAKDYFSKLYLDVGCEFEKTKNQKFCPFCKRKDKVLPVMFGLPIPMFNEKGIEVADKDGRFLKDYYQAGCVSDILCNPSKHCTRCKKDF
jgi:Carboxypeptidase regulatory-like domain